ncbi:hypothetical protein B0H13DRAFT_2326556 [Mycena leptocephala]|nr:hypothetical protein B0H13DRAFT_2326556 [Mycena leptocephala]
MNLRDLLRLGDGIVYGGVIHPGPPSLLGLLFTPALLFYHLPLRLRLPLLLKPTVLIHPFTAHLHTKKAARRMSQRCACAWPCHAPVFGPGGQTALLQLALAPEGNAGLVFATESAVSSSYLSLPRSRRATRPLTPSEFTDTPRVDGERARGVWGYGLTEGFRVLRRVLSATT